MKTRVAIDPNVRVRGNETYAGYEDVEGIPVIGGEVEVWERETGVLGPATVTALDDARQLIYLEVRWAELREPAAVPSLSDFSILLSSGGRVDIQNVWFTYDEIVDGGDLSLGMAVTAPNVVVDGDRNQSGAVDAERPLSNA
jgi:hypothetical protein